MIDWDYERSRCWFPTDLTDGPKEQIVEQDMYALGYAAGLKRGKWEGYRSAQAHVKNVLFDVSDFLDNYTDAEYVDGRPVGNRAMNLKSSVDELL